MTDDLTMTPGPSLAGQDGGPPLSVWATAQRDARTMSVAMRKSSVVAKSKSSLVAS
jgi:hypothetical protein